MEGEWQNGCAGGVRWVGYMGWVSGHRLEEREGGWGMNKLGWFG